jgi:hypothetical protein
MEKKQAAEVVDHQISDVLDKTFMMPEASRTAPAPMIHDGSLSSGPHK